MITKERHKDKSTGDEFTSSSASDMSPMNPPKSPSIGKRGGHASDLNNNNNNNFLGSNLLMVDKKKTMKLLVLGQDGVGKSGKQNELLLYSDISIEPLDQKGEIKNSFVYIFAKKD